MPDWTEQHEPDIWITLVELLAYIGDDLSYYEDAVATEAYLQTARNRVSVRRHARLVGYRLHEGCNARAWVCLNVTSPVSLPLGDVRFAAAGGWVGDGLGGARHEHVPGRHAGLLPAVHPAVGPARRAGPGAGRDTAAGPQRDRAVELGRARQPPRRGRDQRRADRRRAAERQRRGAAADARAARRGRDHPRADRGPADARGRAGRPGAASGRAPHQRAPPDGPPVPGSRCWRCSGRPRTRSASTWP